MYVLDLYRLHTTNGKIFDYLTNSYRDSNIKFINNGRSYLEKILDSCYHYILVALNYFFKESNLESIGLKSGKKLKTNSFDIFKEHIYSKFSSFEDFFEDFCMTITILEVEKITVSAESTMLPTKISYRVGQGFQKLLLEICFE
jgi:hypothetical protein